MSDDPMNNNAQFEKEIQRSKNITFVYQAEDMNAQRRKAMEDAHRIIPCFNDDDKLFYAGVFDGHGGRGVVDWVVSHFDYNLKEAYTSSDLTTVEQCLEYAFLYTDIQTKQNDLCVDGSTGAVVFMQCNDEGKRVLYAANVGDTRIVSCRNGVATRLSYDHKGIDENEILRINASGGFVSKGRVAGLLAVTRSFGDHTLKHLVIAHPYMSKLEITDDDEFILIACDGVFDVMTDQEAVDFVRPHIQKSNPKAASLLINEAIARNSNDNITVVLIGLK